MMLNGNAFIRVIRDERGVAALVVLNPLKVQVSRTSDMARPLYIYDNHTTITHDEMLHIKELMLPGQLRGKSRIELVKENLGLASALEQFAARFFSQTQSFSFDKSGRAGLTAELLKHAGIEKDAVLVGSLTKFNIYNPARWQQEEARTAGDNFGDLMRRLDI
jgi:DNA-binding transcriptional regulator/RsmH inhibitor MraZ